MLKKAFREIFSKCKDIEKIAVFFEITGTVYVIISVVVSAMYSKRWGTFYGIPEKYLIGTDVLNNILVRIILLVVILLMIYCLFYFGQINRKLEKNDNVRKDEEMKNKLFRRMLFFCILGILILLYMQLIINIIIFYTLNNYFVLLSIMFLGVLCCIVIALMVFEDKKEDKKRQYIKLFSLMLFFLIVIINIRILCSVPFSTKKSYEMVGNKE